MNCKVSMWAKTVAFLLLGVAGACSENFAGSEELQGGGRPESQKKVQECNRLRDGLQSAFDHVESLEAGRHHKEIAKVCFHEFVETGSMSKACDAEQTSSTTGNAVSTEIIGALVRFNFDFQRTRDEGCIIDAEYSSAYRRYSKSSADYGGLEKPGTDITILQKSGSQTQTRSDGRTCRSVIENDEKRLKCCQRWLPLLGGQNCVYN